MSATRSARITRVRQGLKAVVLGATGAVDLAGLAHSPFAGATAVTAAGFLLAAVAYADVAVLNTGSRPRNGLRAGLLLVASALLAGGTFAEATTAPAAGSRGAVAAGLLGFLVVAGGAAVRLWQVTRRGALAPDPGRRVGRSAGA